jgi:hypothetical protein
MKYAENRPYADPEKARASCALPHKLTAISLNPVRDSELRHA